MIVQACDVVVGYNFTAQPDLCKNYLVFLLKKIELLHCELFSCETYSDRWMEGLR